MTDTHRKKHPEPLLIPTVIAATGAEWGEETQKVAPTDSQRVLEAMLAEFGIEGAILALNGQGFRGDTYGYLLGPHHAEAMARRARAVKSSAPAAD